MSDLYDSLEDDDDELKPFCDSQNRNTEFSDTVRRACESRPIDNYSFFLNEDVNTNKPFLLPVFHFSNALPQRKLILPKIISNIEETGPEPVKKLIVDNKSLEEQGLQFNNDGSFTKSPRQEKEELPFITREYRNLQFQKKKTYTLNKKNNCQKKKFSVAKTSDGQVSSMTHLNAKKKNGLNEEILASESSLSSTGSQSKTDKQANHNLTDSMKEKLLQTFRKKFSKEPQKLESVRKTKEIINQRVNENWQHDKISKVGRKKTDVVKPQNSPPKENSQKHETVSDKKKTINASQKISKFKSDILLNVPKPKLNYSQRHMLEVGFNPFFLRPRDKILDDSNRSNFGDSVIEELPEVSNRVLSCDNLLLEEEEIFYKKLIEKEQKLKLTQQSSRSEGPIEFVLTTARNSLKGQKEITSGRSNAKSKRFSKSMFIDMPTEGKESEKSCKKCSHYCSITPSSQMSKVELALKGKTYGYMANARNIFKLKAQTEGKFNSTEREKNWKKNVKMSYKDSPESPLPTGRLLKQKSLPVNAFPNVAGEFVRNYQNLPRGSVSLCKTKQPGGNIVGFVLPQVKGPKLKVDKIDAELFEQINSCLVSPHV